MKINLEEITQETLYVAFEIIHLNSLYNVIENGGERRETFVRLRRFA
jgi:hypothetical protein